MYQFMSHNVPEQSEPSFDNGLPSVPDAVRVRRVPERAAYNGDAVNAILDDGLVAHVGTVRDGSPVVIPMFYVRDGDDLLIHGAPASGAIRRGKGTDVCVTVTHVDGLVLARSAFHHSMNYRSVVVVGTAELITDPADKEAALERFVEALVPGRQADLRPNTTKEIDGTGVLKLSLANSSAKVRSGGPVDDEDDYELPIWAGVVPVSTTLESPESDPRNLTGVDVPANIAAISTR
jgi:nitroimidazol reductase NimA-like FMN-containing flavoprotein (pyridoxamine 5'-phosphate oxidase superfamily)